MEIERKYLIKEIPFSLEAYPYKKLDRGISRPAPSSVSERQMNNIFLQ